MDAQELAYLKDMGLDLIYEYGYEPNEFERSVLRSMMPKIKTDFLGFGNNYALIRKHIKEHLQNVKTIVDIGCAWGIFSHMFKDYQYVGLESHPQKEDLFFRYYPHHEFIVGSFPYTNPGGDVFIASMSLGYGDNLTNDDISPELKAMFIREISKYKYGYMKAPEWVSKLVSDVFDKVEVLIPEKILSTSFRKITIKHTFEGLYFWEQKS